MTGTSSNPYTQNQNHRGDTGSDEFQNQSAPIRFESIAAFRARAATQPERSWLIDGLIPDAGRVLIVAPTNAGKTWLALVAALTATRHKRPVYLVEEEGSARGLASRLDALSIPDADNFHIAHLSAVTLDDARHRTHLAKLVAEADAPVLVLDPLVSLSQGDENSTQDANALRAKLEKLAKANPRALLIVLHHTGKAVREGSDPFAARGSSVFPSWADVLLNLEPVKTPKGSRTIKLRVSVAKDREGERGLCRVVTVNAATGEVSAEDAAPQEQGALETAVMQVVRKALEPMTKNGIWKAVGGNKQTALAAVDALVRRGELAATGAKTPKFTLPRPAESVVVTDDRTPRGADVEVTNEP